MFGNLSFLYTFNKADYPVCLLFMCSFILFSNTLLSILSPCKFAIRNIYIVAGPFLQQTNVDFE